MSVKLEISSITEDETLLSDWFKCPQTGLILRLKDNPDDVSEHTPARLSLCNRLHVSFTLSSLFLISLSMKGNEKKKKKESE